MVVDLGFSLGFTDIVTGTGVLSHEAPAHPEQSVLSSSHYPDNTSAGTLVRMCHSSVGSLGTAREQFVPQRHRPRPHRRHHLLCSSRQGGERRLPKSEGAPWRWRSQNVPFRPSWLASRCKTKAQLKHGCLVFQLIKRQIRCSPNYPVGNASVALPREHYELSIRDLCSTPKAAGTIKTASHWGLHFKRPLKSKETLKKILQEIKISSQIRWPWPGWLRCTDNVEYGPAQQKILVLLPASKLKNADCWWKKKKIFTFHTVTPESVTGDRCHNPHVSVANGRQTIITCSNR